MKERFIWTKKHTALLALGPCVLAFLGYLVFLNEGSTQERFPQKTEASIAIPAEPGTSTRISVTPFLEGAPMFWGDRSFFEPCPSAGAEPVLILPHYIPAYTFTKRAIAAWKACRATVDVHHVIVVSPDHHHRLATGLTTLAVDGYATPLGMIDVDPAFRARLQERGIPAQTDLFYTEHGAGAFPIFIKTFFPEATFTPLVISAKATQEEVRAAADVLREKMRASSTLVIITADFSHYLAQDRSNEKDRETLRAIEDRNEAFLWGAKDDHTDLGRGLWLAIQLMDASKTFFVERTLNSAELGGDRHRTTGFVWGWWQDRSRIPRGGK